MPPFPLILLLAACSSAFRSRPSAKVESEAAEQGIAGGCSGTPNRGQVAAVPVPNFAFRSRSQWAAADFACRDDCKAMNPSRITIHHTATPASTSVATMQEWHQTKGWCDIGYHFLIDMAGTIFQGRPFWDDLHTPTGLRAAIGQWPQMALIEGSHVGGSNTDNIGISLIGCFDTGSGCSGMQMSINTSSTQYRAVVELVAYLADMYGIAVTPASFKGHRDLGSTSCPGDILYGLLDDVVADANQLISDPGGGGGGGGSDGEGTICQDNKGLCIDVSTTSCPRSTLSGLCSGGNNIKCCPSSYPGVGTPCSSTPGVCVDTRTNGCSRATLSGQCPGDSYVKCCPYDTSSNGVGSSCDAGWVLPGNCIDITNDSCHTSTLIGRCPGSSSVQCCPRLPPM